MASTEDEYANFQLVSTYVPLAMLLLRALSLIFLVPLALTVTNVPSCLFSLICAVVYFDAYLFRHDKLNRACGFLCPIALCLVQVYVIPEQFIGCEKPHVIAIQWTVDMCWAVSCTTFVAVVLYKGVFPVDVLHASVAWAGLAVAHFVVQCEQLDTFLIVIRMVVYYLICAAYFFFRNNSVTVDRNMHQQSVMHIYLHIMFVKMYVLIGSVLIGFILFGSIYYLKYRLTSYPAVVRSPIYVQDLQTDDLMKELRAAKSASATNSILP